MISRLRRTFTLFVALTPLALAQSYTMTTLAGTSRLRDGSQAKTVPLRYPFGVAQDAAGNVYFADASDHRVRRVAVDGTITTIAGTGVAGFSGDNGPATKATFNTPEAIKLDGKGNLFIADYLNNRVRKVVLATGIITTVAGNGDYHYAGDNGPALQAGLDPNDIAVDSDDNIYIADNLNNRIRKVSAVDGTIATLAGIGPPGDGDNGPANQAALNAPTGISVDSQGMVYFIDSNNNRVKKIDQRANHISTAAGTGDLGYGVPRLDGDGGAATSAYLALPFSTAVEANGNLLIQCIFELWRVTVADGRIHFLGGSTIIGFAGDGSAASTAQFAYPIYIGAAPNGDIVIADLGNYRVRRIHLSVVDTVAGTTISDNIPATSAFLNGPDGIVADGKGGVLVGDTGDSRVRAVSSAGVITNVLGTGVRSAAQGNLFFPRGLAIDSQGATYIADDRNNRIVRLLPSGNPTVAAGGNGAGFSGDNNFAGRAQLNSPHGVAVDSAGVIYIADTFNFRVRMVDTSGNITTLAGNGLPGFSGDNGPADKARVTPNDLALDSSGNLYIADVAGNRIRKVNLATRVITTVAGIGTAGFTGDGGPATSAQLNIPTGIALDSSGALYIADYGNSVVRRVSGGIITTIAGTGSPYFDVESATAIGVSIDPVRVAADRDGSIYIADRINDRIRKLTVATPTRLAIALGDGQSGPTGARAAIGVKIIDASSLPVGNVPVTFSVTSGSASLSAPTALSGADGIASVQVTFGAAAGPVKITAASPGLPSATFSLTTTPPAVTTPSPQIDDGGVKGAALSAPPVQALSTGGIATVFGKNFGGAATFQSVATGDLVNGKVPTNYHGICVEVAGARAPIFGASNTQVNFQVPLIGTSGTVSVRVIASCGTANQLASSAVNVAAQSSTSEFFYFVQNATGKNPVAATDSLTGAYLAAADLFPGSGITAAHAKQYVTVYATGFGATTPSFTPGDYPDQLAGAAASVRVLLGGRELPAANVLYAGVTPFSPGLYQLNLLLPDDTPDGDLSLVIEIGGVQSPAGPYLTVRSGY